MLLYEYKEINHEIQLPYIKDMGDVNNLPTPNNISSLDEYFHYSFTYSPKYEEFRQVRVIEGGRIYNTKIIYFDEMAFAILQVPEKVQVIKIGCTLEWNLLGRDNTRKKYYCQYCNIDKIINSSD